MSTVLTFFTVPSIEAVTYAFFVERLQNEIASNKSQIAELEKEKKNADQDAAVSYTTQILSLQSDNAKNEYDIKAHLIA